MRRRRTSRQAYHTEADFCAPFLAALRRAYQEKWIANPETETRTSWSFMQKDGFQIGIQAKLALNASVIDQCLEYGESTGDK